MANFENLKTQIQAVIRENGNNEITGIILQQALIAMISSLGNGYLFKGTAAPTDNPGTPDQNVVYLTATAGTYTNFGGLTVDAGKLTILAYNGTWIKFEIADLAEPSSKEGVISQTQTWTRAADNGYDYSINPDTIVRGNIPISFIDLWNTACVVNGVTYGTFNELTGYFELNGITDISYQEAQRIMITSAGLDPHLLTRWMYRFTARTNLPLFWFDPTDWPQYALNSNVATNLGYEHKGEIILLPPSPDNNPVWILQLSNISAFVYGARHIKEIRNPFKILDNSIADTAFALAYNLEEVRIHSLKADIKFPNSARLSKDSVLYMINNEAATAEINIYLNTAVFVQLIDDPDIAAAITAHPNINLEEV